MSRTKVSKDFYADEYACKCGRKGCRAVPPTKELIDLVQAIRNDLGIPLTLSSASRCPYWNEHEGGGRHSRHLSGEAGDIRSMGGYMKFKIIKSAIKNGAKGIGIGETFVHVDVRPIGSAWGYGNAD